jgi:hypothetical protein
VLESICSVPPRRVSRYAGCPVTQGRTLLVFVYRIALNSWLNLPSEFTEGSSCFNALPRNDTKASIPNRKYQDFIRPDFLEMFRLIVLAAVALLVLSVAKNTYLI